VASGRQGFSGLTGHRRIIMAINMQYKSMQVQPGTVHFHGQVILAAGPVIDSALTITAGVTVTRGGVGLYTLAFNDGETVGATSLVLQSIRASTGDNAFTFAVIGTGLAAQSSVVAVEVSDLTGTLADPGVGEGFCYVMTRLNTSVIVK